MTRFSYELVSERKRDVVRRDSVEAPKSLKVLFVQWVHKASTYHHIPMHTMHTIHTHFISFFFYMWHWHILTPKCRSDSNPWGIFMDGLPLDVSLGPSTGTVWEKMTQFMMINRLSACSGKEHLEIVDMNLLCAYLWRPMTCFMSFLPLFWCKLTFMFSFRKQTLVLSCIVLWLR